MMVGDPAAHAGTLCRGRCSRRRLRRDGCASTLVPAVAAAVGSTPGRRIRGPPTGTRSAARTRSTRSRCCSNVPSRRSQPERKGVEDLYFVGVAGYAAEDVFMKEMAVVRRAVPRPVRRGRPHDHAGEQSEDRRASSRWRAPRRSRVRSSHLGEVLNPDEDVLFLYLTSHGSEDHRLAMQFWPLQLDDIDPAMLKQMLDESGIKWRVIVISACYSGGFVDSLKDDRTMIVTAADAFHQSFGCGSDVGLHLLRQGLLRRGAARHLFVPGRLRPGATRASTRASAPRAAHRPIRRSTWAPQWKPSCAG